MSNSFQMYQKPENFVLEDLVVYLQNRFQSQGYSVITGNVGNAVTITIQKNIGGISTITGLGEQITLTLSVKDNQLTTFSSNQMWTDKIVAFIIGWFCFWITWIPGAIGAYKQIQLPNEIHAAIFTFIAGL